MGVDYSVVCGYGREVEVSDKLLDAEEREGIDRELSKRGFRLIQAGCYSYTGKRSDLMLALAVSDRERDARRDRGGWIVQPSDSPPVFDVDAAMAVAAEFGLVFKGPVGWLAGLHVH